MGLFDKKYCDICGEKIGLLGNRKLEDGNLCKECAKKLSPWFSDRRNSTVSEIRGQLTYREENRQKAAKFQTSRSMGEDWKVLLDETHRWFTVTRARDLAEANPDILDYSALTGCRMNIDESRSEVMRKNQEGKEVSYVPPRYEYSYDFEIIITVSHPYFDEMKFRLNSSSVYFQPQPTAQRPMAGRMANVSAADPETCVEYRQYRQMGEELCAELERIRTGGSAGTPAPEGEDAGVQSAANTAAPAAAGPWICPACGGANNGRFCEYCGSPRP